MSGTGPYIALTEATLAYPRRVILEEIHLELHRGDFALVTGANGEGKSTLMRGLLGTLPLRHGRRVLAAGVRLGYMPQQHQLDSLFPITVREVVGMGLWQGPGLPRKRKPEDDQRIDASLDRVSMEHRRTESFAALSGGQKQRVLLARTLVGDAQLLLLDEPIAGVDQDAESLLLRVLEQLPKQGHCVVCISHRERGLASIATRRLVIGSGRVSEVSP